MSWRRLEAGSLDPDMAEGVRAEIADPLWLLARQYQVGEFHGEDAAAPVLVRAKVRATPITAYSTEDGPTVSRVTGGGGLRPLEALAEAEALAQSPEADRIAVELGWLLLRELRRRRIPQSVVARLRGRFPPPVIDSQRTATDSVTRLLAVRSIDGLAAQAAVDKFGSEDLATELGATGADSGTLTGALKSWRQASGLLAGEPTAGPAWSDRHLAYRYRLAAPTSEGEIQLAARDYDGRALDWHHHDVETRRRKPLEPAGRPNEREHVVLPTPLRYHGMPAARFWELEDQAVDFGALVGGPDDLARSVVSGFAAAYGDD